MVYFYMSCYASQDAVSEAELSCASW